MNIQFRITQRLLDVMRSDLHRPHPFAMERVGFLRAGVAQTAQGDLLILSRAYMMVEDDDYEKDTSVGAKIGSNAMRKALQAAYRNRSALFHVHSHGGQGRPDFSGVDLRSGGEFVPGFFHTIARVPHGMIVLSRDSAKALVWFDEHGRGNEVSQFVQVGAPIIKFGERS